MIESIRLMAIIRDVEPVYAVPIAETLVSEGITGIEVSLSDAEKGFGCIENIQKRFSPDKICLGAGTVTKKESMISTESLISSMISASDLYAMGASSNVSAFTDVE